ncbi:MAG TPA: hypothetical protein PLK37_15585 [Terricaulis sp.]|nr:hypothetical protein [Terricaulis sp.]
MRKIVALILCAAAGAPLAAQAQEQPQALFISPMGQPVRGAERGAALTAWFSAADADQDGRLSLEEFLAHEMPFHSVLDRNQDGLVTALESNALYRATAPEMYAPLPALRGATAQMPRDPGRLTQPRERQRTDTRRRGAARFGLLHELEPVMSCDTDMSRWVSAEEFRLCAERRFVLLDSDSDGLFALADSPRAQELLADPEED